MSSPWPSCWFAPRVCSANLLWREFEMSTEVFPWSQWTPTRVTRRAALQVAVAIVAASLLAVLPLLVDDYVLSAILVPFLALSLAGIGQNLVTGYAGQLSLGSAAFMSVGAFATYDLHLHFPSTPLLVAFAFGGIAAAFAGALFGLPSLRIRG